MFDLQGHRGARGLFPENTLEGFRAAMELGITSFEIDVGVTRDDVAVVHHDPHLNPDLARGPDGEWLARRGRPLRELSWDELQRFDVGRIRPGTAYAAAYASQAPVDGARIPALEQVLALPARFNIELKLIADHPEWTVAPERMVGLALEAIDRAGAADRVTVQSFDWRGPRHVGRVRPAIARGWLTRAETVRAAPLWRGDARASPRMEDAPAAVAAEGGGTWTPRFNELTPSLLHGAHDLGLKVIPWTVNERDDMRRLIAWGVDGLISDWPDRTLALLDARQGGS